jgi:hypothetical protein
MAEMRWDEVRSYLDESECALLAELSQARRRLHQPVPGGWSIAQIVHHLVRTEQVMYPVWAVIPKFRRFPRCVQAVDAANAALWRLLGMRTVESAKGRLTAVNATEGRYRAPVFLRPARGVKSYDELLEWRRSTRNRSLRAITSVDQNALNSLRWSHPLLGSYTLMEFAQFLGIHERHHLPQIQRIREADPGHIV